MKDTGLRFLTIANTLLLLALSFGASSFAQGGLKTINPQQGGKIVYGQAAGQTTEAGAMGAVLRSLHQSLGEKPKVGKLFEVRGTDSVATFFTVTRHDQGAGKAPLQVAGLLIATKISTDHVEVALVSDDASRFPKTLSPMMKTLMSAWHPFAGVAGSSSSASGAANSASSGSPAELHRLVTQDRSAAISVPNGWQLMPRSGGGGLVAMGPHGETAEMDSTYLAGDTNNPNVQRTMRTVQSGGLRNTSYANGTYYPYGANQAKTFVDLAQDSRRKQRLPAASYNITGASPIPANSQQHCTRLAGTVDYRDGKGVRELDAVYCVNPPGRFGNWMSFANVTTIPQQFAAGERATLRAVMQSFTFDSNIVQHQAAAYAAPSERASIAAGNAATQRVNAAHQAEAIHNSSVYQHWDSIDRRSQEFENYQLGYAVVADTGNNVHGTLWADDAALLVQNNPDKYEYVSAPNYWKGVDY
ncbi:MAG: hypothetical protein ABSF53_24705 [Terracidiphilus sp.]